MRRWQLARTSRGHGGKGEGSGGPTLSTFQQGCAPLSPLLLSETQASHGKRIAVIENEFGEVGIDDALLATNARVESEDQILEVLNGCICCTVRKDLVSVMQKLAKRVANGEIKLDAIVIETTGMADPSPVAQTFFVDEAVKDFARLDGIITLVDAAHIEQHLDDEKAEGVENEAVEQAPRIPPPPRARAVPAASTAQLRHHSRQLGSHSPAAAALAGFAGVCARPAAQVAFADRLLLNKVDLVQEADLTRVEARLRTINEFAPIRRCQQSQVMR